MRASRTEVRSKEDSKLGRNDTFPSRVEKISRKVRRENQRESRRNWVIILSSSKEKNDATPRENSTVEGRKLVENDKFLSRIESTQYRENQWKSFHLGARQRDYNSFEYRRESRHDSSRKSISRLIDPISYTIVHDSRKGQTPNSVVNIEQGEEHYAEYFY